MGCGCDVGPGKYRSMQGGKSGDDGGFRKLRKPSYFDQLQCMDCAVTGAVMGGVSYYFVPGANNGNTALMIAGSVFLGQVVARMFSGSFSNFISY